MFIRCLLKINLAIILVFTFEMAVLSQPKNKLPDKTINSEIQMVILEAKSLQPEVTAFIYLKLISQNKIQDKAKEKQLLEEAFYLAFQAQEKIQRKIIAFEGQVLTIRPSIISDAHRYKLNTLSLQSQIVSEMLKIDRTQALVLFNEISPNLSLKPLSCQDILLYETDEFYELIGKIAKSSFSQEQISQGQRIVFLSSYIENLSSPSQISPILKMLSSIDLSNDEIFSLTSIFNKSIRKIYGDDRSFFYEMNYGLLNRVFYEFSKKLYFNQSIYKEFIESYKNYLLKNTRGVRCEDNIRFERRTAKIIDDTEDPPLKLPIYIYEANKIFYKDLPISLEEIKPSEVEKFNFPVEYFSSGKSNQIFSKLRKLQNWQDENKTISEIKDSLDWQEAFSNLLEIVDEWDGTDNENEIDVFHQKSLIYQLLLREAPSVILKETVTKKYLKLLNQTQIQKEFTQEWFLEFNYLLNEIRENNSKTQQSELFELIKNSNNTSIRIYFDLEKILSSDKSY